MGGLHLLCTDVSTAAEQVRSDLCFHGSAVDGHACYGVYAHGVQVVDFLLFLDAAGDDQLFRGAGAQDAGDVHGESGHGSFGVDVGVEEGGAVVLKPGDGFLRREVYVFLPAFDGDLATLGVNGEDELVFAERLVE